MLAEERAEAREDGARCLAAQLLVGNRLDKGLKRRQQSRFETKRTHTLDDLRHNWIGLGQMAHGFFVHIGKAVEAL